MYFEQLMDSTQLSDEQVAQIKQTYNKERRVITFCLIIVILLTTHDMIEDINQTQVWYYIVADIAYMGIIVWLLLYIWRHTPLALKKRNIMLTQEVIKHHKDAKQWSQKAQELLSGLSGIISEQMDCWDLSAAEKQIALLILKGLSLKEIATIRNTSERTVRQQAAQAYNKAGVSNRAELSAFFLEDLLLP